VGPELKRYQLFIDGEFRDAVAKHTFNVLSPSTNEVIAEVASGTTDDVECAVESAYRAFRSGVWSGLEVQNRVKLLHRLGELILSHCDQLASVESLDTGNPIRYTRECYIPGAAECFQFFPNLAYHLTGEQIPVSTKRLDYTVYEPLGVVAVIVPWNDPLEIAAARLASALAVGNSCILKPSPLAPLTCLELGQLVQEAGLPPGVLNVLAGSDAELGIPLIHHPRVNMISFTGSVRTGELIQCAAAESTKRVSLEMGGKSAVLIFADADIESAVEGATQGILLMSGQNCIAGSRLFLHEAIYDQFLARLVEQFSRFPVGDPMDPETVLGPLISRAQLDKVESYIASGLEQGARLLTGGHSRKDISRTKGNYLMPTIFTEVTPSMRIAREEIFGPVLCVFKFSSTESAIEMANDTDYGLGAGIWTRDIKVAHCVASRLRAGTVYVNTFNEFYNSAPFAGHRRSGLGSEYGLDALYQYVQRKNVIVRLD
jgi:aldehyde dehydrogenase (NAD+)